MTTTVQATDQPTFIITEEIFVQRVDRDDVRVARRAAWAGSTKRPTASRMPMILETKPGGRWYRDLGGDNGHHWGFVQSIKRPALLEIWGPLFMSTGDQQQRDLPAVGGRRRHADLVQAHPRRPGPRRDAARTPRRAGRPFTRAPRQQAESTEG